MKDPERFKPCREPFERAMELDPAAREKFLQDECAGDPSLRRDVDALIESDLAANERKFVLQSRRGEVVMAEEGPSRSLSLRQPHSTRDDRQLLLIADDLHRVLVTPGVFEIVTRLALRNGLHGKRSLEHHRAAFAIGGDEEPVVLRDSGFGYESFTLPNVGPAEMLRRSSAPGGHGPRPPPPFEIDPGRSA